MGLDHVPFSVYETSAAQLQEWLRTSLISSVDLINAYLDQIGNHNIRGAGLRAVIDTAPRSLAIERARFLDEERALKGSRGPLHGIPVLVKDLFNTDPSFGMATTSGSLALRNSMPKGNAAIVDLLIEAGAIVIAKTNLSELAGVKGNPACTAGWSAAGGQSQSPYVEGGVDKDDTFLGHSTAAGSTSGSAAGVTAGFAPISIGSETDGSLVYPAARAGLYGLKLHHGACSLAGCFPVHPAFDCHGLLARTTQDLATLTSVAIRNEDFSAALQTSWEGLRLGLIDPEGWLLGPNEVKTNAVFDKQSAEVRERAIKSIEAAGGQIVRSVKLITVEELAQQDGGVDFDVICFDNYRANVDLYLADLAESPVRSLRDMVDYNKRHAESCLPSGQSSQRFLEDQLNAEPDPEFEKKLAWLRRESRAHVEEALREYQIDAIIAPDDSRLCAIAAAAGYAAGSLPLAYAEFIGRGFGMQIIAGDKGEKTILRVMSAWEKMFPEGREAPPLMVQHKL